MPNFEVICQREVRDILTTTVTVVADTVEQAKAKAVDAADNEINWEWDRSLSSDTPIWIDDGDIKEVPR